MIGQDLRYKKDSSPRPGPDLAVRILSLGYEFLRVFAAVPHLLGRMGVRSVCHGIEGFGFGWDGRFYIPLRLGTQNPHQPSLQDRRPTDLLVHDLFLRTNSLERTCTILLLSRTHYPTCPPPHLRVFRPELRDLSLIFFSFFFFHAYLYLYSFFFFTSVLRKKKKPGL